MCGIFGIIGQSHNNLAYIKSLSRHAKRRGQDSSGIMMFQDEYSVQRADFDISKLTKDLRIKNPEIFLGIGRLITNDNQAKQPFLSDDICVFHNGIIVNDNEVFEFNPVMNESVEQIATIVLNSKSRENFSGVSNIDPEIIRKIRRNYMFTRRETN